MADDLVTRTCDKCGLTDTDPHHIQYVAFVHPVTGEGTDLSVSKHLDCCASDGCPVCTVDLEFAQDARGGALRELLVDKSRDWKQALFERCAIETPEFFFPATSEEA